MRSLVYIVSLFMLVSLVVLSGCSKDDPENLEGVYTGTFHRTGPSIRPVQADVTVYLADGKFSGTSSQPQYPAICSGTFTVRGNRVNAENACFFTADFDWTLILNGSYEYELSGDRLLIQRAYGDGNVDRYELRRGH